MTGIYSEKELLKTAEDNGFDLEAEFLLDHTPTIDAVPVVRCWECKNHCDTNGKHYCKFWRMYCPDDSDFFCKAGERKEGAE